jgi:hypothetical protein
LNDERPFGGSRPLLIDFWISKEEKIKEEKKRKEDE